MYTIRNTKDSDIISLIEIEKSVAKAFLEDPDLAWIANSSVQTIDGHRKTIINGYSILAAHESGQLVSFFKC
ncbi:hypothetical protein [Acinetobacter soli]|nr:hypothetical protein [Acinetobacter soli]